MVATGQVGKSPQIFVWNPQTMKSLSVLQGSHTNAVCALGFSNSGKQLASIDDSNDHIMCIWNWEDGTKIIEKRTAKDKVILELQ